MHPGRPISVPILIVDSDRDLSERLEVFLRKRGYRVALSPNASEAMAYLTQQSFDMALVDAPASGLNGLQLLDQINSYRRVNSIVVMSSYPSVEQSVEAMHRGAADYTSKPFELYEVAKVLERVAKRHWEASTHPSFPARKGSNGRSPGDVRNPQRKLDSLIEHSSSGLPGKTKTALIGSSDAMKQLFLIIDRIAQLDSSILITGATGTGKELVAHAIHERSHRAAAPFVDINCSAIPDSLVEAEFFGHERGTFTGANETRRGLFEEATGGTIFLDEVDALDLSAQVKLLRVLQERKLRRVGGRENIPIDVRIISATNSDLMLAVAKGKFRADLLFRLCVVPLQIPALRERGNDIKLLINHFLHSHMLRGNSEPKRFSADAMKMLLQYSWPGNVRELENAVEYALAIGTTEELGIDDLPPNVIRNSERYREVLEESSDDNLRLDEVERRYIIATLKRFGGHQIKTAAALGIDRRTLYRKLHRYQIKSGVTERRRSII